MTESDNHVAFEELTIRQLFLSLKIRQFIGLCAFLVGIVVAAFSIGMEYASSKKELEIATMETNKVSLESQLEARDDRIEQLLAEKINLESEKRTLSEESSEYRSKVSDLTKTIAKWGLCEPIRTQLGEAIRIHGQTKERLLALETAHKDYRVEETQIETTRQQVSELEGNVESLKEELGKCQNDVSESTFMETLSQ